MTFKLNKTGKFTRPNITIETIGEDGKWQKESVTLTFLSPKTEELEELHKLKPRDVLEAHLVGVAGLLDDDGNQVEFNDANKAAFLSMPAVVAAASRAFWEGVVRAPKG